MTIPNTQCAFCKHFRGDDRTGNFCDAFPDGDGIPQEIIDNDFDHRQPHKGDHGIQFEALPGQHHPLEDADAE